MDADADGICDECVTIFEEVCVAWEDIYEDGDCAQWIDVFGSQVCVSYEQILVGQNCVSYEMMPAGLDCDCAFYEDEIAFHCVNSSGYATNDDPFSCAQNGWSWEPYVTGQLVCPSTHALGHMTIVGCATDPETFTAVGALKCQQAIVIAMETNWMPLVSAEVHAQLMSMTMEFVMTWMIA